MEIVYSASASTVEDFIKNYRFCLEQSTFSSFILTPRLTNDLRDVYKTLLEMSIEPSHYVSWCFSRRSIIRPKDLMVHLDGFNYGTTVDPIANFREIIRNLIENLRTWSLKRIDYYRIFEPDVRLAIFEPDIRFILQTKKCTEFSERYLNRLWAMMMMLGFAKLTIEIMREEWIPFVWRTNGKTILD